MPSRKLYGGWLILFIVFFIPLPAYADGEEVTSDRGQAVETVSAERAGAPADEQEEFAEEKPIADPLEPWNRLVFSLNDGLYFAFIKPVAQAYSFIVPEWGRVRVRNVFDNLKTPVRFVSSLLQGKMKGAGNELVRFLLNTTLGIGGMFDVAEYDLQIKGSDEDLGQTLGRYGIGEGFFIVWPVLGPSSVRDSFGMVGDFFLHPVSYITPFEDWLAVRSFQFENDISLKIGEYEDMKEAALDPYVAMKDAYSEYRRSKVKEDRTDTAPGPGWPVR